MDNKDATLMEIPVNDQIIKNYQALYYAMNAKPDCKSKIFSKIAIIHLSDLKVLNNRIVDKFKNHYDDAGFRINININLKNHECLEFDSWATFDEYDFSFSEAINSILIVWEYNAKLPGYPLPQKHTLTVRIADEIRAEEMLNLVISGKLEEVDKIDEAISPIVARVDFINSTLGDELIAIVEKWQETLLEPENEQHSLYKYLKKCKRLIAYFINYGTTLVAIWVTVQVIYHFLVQTGVESFANFSIPQFGMFMKWIVYGSVICVLIYKISQVVGNMVFSNLRTEGEIHIFDVTPGDKNLNQKIAKQQRSNRAKVVINIIGTFAFNIICSLVANYIS